MTAPMMPDRAYGRTARRIVSQRVAPSANIASRCESGTAPMTSREIVTIVGRIMIVEDHPGAEQADAVGRAAEERDPAEDRHDPGLDRSAQERRQDEDAPQADDDARDRGQQLDHERQRGGQATGRQLREVDRGEDADRGGQRCAIASGREIVPTMNGSAP